MNLFSICPVNRVAAALHCGTMSSLHLASAARGSVLLAACLFVQAPAAAVELSGRSPFLDVVVQPRIALTKSSPPQFEVRTRESQTVDLLLYDDQGRVVYYRPGLAGQNHSFTVEAMPRVSTPFISYLLLARSAAGEVVAYYPEEPKGGEIAKVRDSKLLSETGHIQFAVPRLSVVRVRAGLKDGPCLETILPWQPMTAGQKRVAWDGTCQDGILRNLYQHPSILVTAVAITLPLNVLAVETPDPVVSSVTAKKLPAALQRFAKPPWQGFPTRLEGELSRVLADYRLNLQVEPDGKNPSIRIRLDCHPNDRERLLNDRFEVMLFVDTIFLTEEEQGILPFRYTMSTRGLSSGRHFITVNVVDREGRLGTATRAFAVKEGLPMDDRE